MTKGRRGLEIAVRPQMEAASDWMLRAVLGTSEDGILLTDLDHNSLACNSRFGEIFGVDWRAVVRMEPQELRKLVLPIIEDSRSWLESLEAVYTDPAIVLRDDIILSRQGRSFIRRFSGPVTDAGGLPVGRVWTFRDVTAERRETEAYRALSEIAQFHDPDPSIVCHQILELVSQVFDGTTAILSIRSGDFLQFKDLVGPKSSLSRISGNRMQDSYCQYAIREVRPLMIQDGRLDPSYRPSRALRSGLTRYLGAPVLDEQGNPIGTICILDCNSDRELAESDLRFMTMVAMRLSSELGRERRMRARLAEKDEDIAATRAVLQAMNAGFALLAEPIPLSDLLRSETKLLAEIEGVSGAAVLLRREGQTAFQGYAATPRVVAASLDSGSFLSATETFAQKLGTPHILHSTRRQEGIGESMVVLGLAKRPRDDVRNGILIEALADQICLAVETNILHSALTSATNELSRAQDELLRSEKLTVAGTLAASAAHDIRNITTSLALLAAPGVSEPLEALGAVREQLGRFNLLAQRLLSYAQPRDIELQHVDLCELVENVLALASAQVRIARVRVDKRFARGLPKIAGAPHHLEHLFLNLILNALQAMPATGGTISIDVSQSGADVRLRFADSGGGISREVLKDLFQPFRSGRANGLGLGLHSCKRIVEAHGGTIGARRNPVRGTTFTITLPIENTCKPAS